MTQRGQRSRRAGSVGAAARGLYRSPDSQGADGPESSRRSSVRGQGGAKLGGPERAALARAGGSALAGEQVEGHHAVRQLLVSRRRGVHVLWADETSARAGHVRELVELARRTGTRVELKSREALLAAAGTGSPQGVIAWAEPLPVVPVDEVPAPARGRDLLIVLDGVSDPGNLGSVLRVAACAGAVGVVVGRHRSAPLTAAAVKAAAGAAEVVPLVRAPGVPGALAKLKAAGWWAVGLDPGARDTIWATDLLDAPVALVLGSEGKGLSRLTRNRCDGLAAVPLDTGATAASIGSLNVACACAIGCFEVARRRACG